MREFEFRAWDGELKAIVFGDDIETFRMPPPPDSESSDEGPSRYITGLSYGRLFVAYYRNGDWQECKIMQFTGLRDKNGKEIYEGDIIRIGKTTRTVGFKDGCFVSIESRCSLATIVNGGFNPEVIGNIYENPDLVTP